MTLAISSFVDVPSTGNFDEPLDLSWTLDEREFLSIDLLKLLHSLLEEQLQRELPCIRSYLVHDPWGEASLRDAVASFFSIDVKDFRVTCGAGVMSLLYTFAQIFAGNRAYIIGDVFPDFPHWASLRGSVCTTREIDGSTNAVDGHIAAAQDSGSGILLIDRPALMADDLSLQQLGELCAGVSRFGAYVLVDESYANYYPPSFSAVHLVAEFPNIAVLRGLSKAYSLGGIRIAYCVASSGLTDRLRASLAPMLVSSLSLWIASRVLQLGDVTGPLRQQIFDMRIEVARILQEAGLSLIRQGSSCMPHLVCGDRDGGKFLCSRGIVAKQQPFWAGEFRHLCRVSIPLSPARLKDLRCKLGKQL